MTRIVRRTSEFEGVVSEQLMVEGEDIPPYPPDRTLTTVGTPQPRIDGAARVTGAARFVHDLTFPGMLTCLVLRSPHARAIVRDVDASAAMAIPGVRDVMHAFNSKPVPFRGEPSLFRTEVQFAGDEVAAVLAETEDAALTALDRIVVEYEVLEHAVDVGDSMRGDAPRLKDEGNVKETLKHDRGDVDAALAGADVTIEAEYRTSAQLHNSMEPHGAVALWDGDTLTVHESTQNIFGVRAGLKGVLGLPFSKIRVKCEYMGGGFGSKNNIGKYTVLACLFAMKTGRPVRALLNRWEENVAAGSRSQTLQRIRIGVRGGAITGIEHFAYASAGQSPGVSSPTNPTNVLHDIANVRTRSHAVQTNVGNWAAFRAPGHVEGAFALESAIDEVAAKAGLDPLALRRKHADVQRDPYSGQPYSFKALARCYERGAELVGWSRRKPEGLPGSTRSRRRGIGMASQTWSGGGTTPAYVTVHVNPDGTVIVRCGTQEIGTGTKTTLAMIMAEELGIPLSWVSVEVGDTVMPYAPLSAGSLTTPSLGPTARLAGNDALIQLKQILGGLLEVGPDEVRIQDGRVIAGGASMGLAEALAKVGSYTVIGRGQREPNPENTLIRSFGAHFVDLEVDTATGEIFVH
ncbi:MAG: xanthine dehydrogenase family protein molybdopterin-binding subunit, partial [Chloroflexi bacterium]|nr:xanthine dehydrogenase family protein molybdopterin-binding subunit [Chloroflexota bacterium]